MGSNKTIITINKEFRGKLSTTLEEHHENRLAKSKSLSEEQQIEWEKRILKLTDDSNQFPGFLPKEACFQDINGYSFITLYLVSSLYGDSMDMYSFTTETSNHIITINFGLIEKEPNFNEDEYIREMIKITDSIILF